MYLQKILSIVGIILMLKTRSVGCTNNSTVCYGVFGLSCTSHRLACPSPLVIQIINTSYGYRPGCNDVNGLSSCDNKTCCNEECGDCFIPFSSKEDQQVARDCSRQETCELPGFRRYNVDDTVCNDSAVSAYSKIQYNCVSNDFRATSAPANWSSTSTKDCDTDDSSLTAFMTNSTSNGDGDDDSGSIVGGIIGAVIIIVIIVLVVVFLYKRQRKKKSPSKRPVEKEMTSGSATPQYITVIDDPGSININNVNSGYDEIELDTNRPKIQTNQNYDNIRDDELKSESTKRIDNYNRIGHGDLSVHEDNYNHIGNNLSKSPRQLDTGYNHITGVFGTSDVEDDYNHIGYNDNKKVIIDDNYHHIRSGDIQVEGDNNEHNDGNDNECYEHAHDEDNESPYKLATS